jgi:hypothetical protein
MNNRRIAGASQPRTAEMLHVPLTINHFYLLLSDDSCYGAGPPKAGGTLQGRKLPMATDAQKSLWQEQMHQEYCVWIESINAGNRARAHFNGGIALITDPETGRQRMDGLNPGQIVWFDVNDGPGSQRGRRHFYGRGWHGPFPENDLLTTIRDHLRGPPTLADRIYAWLCSGTPERPASTLRDRIRAALRGNDVS